MRHPYRNQTQTLMQHPLYPKLSIETLDAKIHSGRAEVGATRFDPIQLTK